MNPIILTALLLLISFSTTTASPLAAFSIRDFFSDDLNGTTTSTTTTTAASYPVDEVNLVDVKDVKKSSFNGTRRTQFSIPEFIIPLPDDPRIRRPVEAFLALLIPALNHSIIAAQEIVRRLPKTVSVRVSQDTVSAIIPTEKRQERSLEIDEVIPTTESTGEGRDHSSSDSIDELFTKDTPINGLPIFPITFLQADQLDGDSTIVHKVTTEESVASDEVSDSRHARSAPVPGGMMVPGYPHHSPYGLGHPFYPVYNPLGIGFMG